MLILSAFFETLAVAKKVQILTFFTTQNRIQAGYTFGAIFGGFIMRIYQLFFEPWLMPGAGRY